LAITAEKRVATGWAVEYALTGPDEPASRLAGLQAVEVHEDDSGARVALRFIDAPAGERLRYGAELAWMALDEVAAPGEPGLPRTHHLRSGLGHPFKPGRVVETGAATSGPREIIGRTVLIRFERRGRDEAPAAPPIPSFATHGRQVEHHRGDWLNDRIQVIALGPPGVGGAPQRYRIDPLAQDHPQGAINPAELHFQSGDPRRGINGLTNEALLAVLIDRLDGFQAGPSACDENSAALSHCLQALDHLRDRTRRLERERATPPINTEAFLRP
jgi:hypothetical protein